VKVRFFPEIVLLIEGSHIAATLYQQPHPRQNSFRNPEWSEELAPIPFRYKG
jgi:hypothetical protein